MTAAPPTSSRPTAPSPSTTLVRPTASPPSSGYPRSPPLVSLSPTRDMVVKPNHPLVVVANAPYLHSWVFPSSNLVDLVRSLSHLFALDLIRPSSPGTPPPTNPTPTAAHSPSATYTASFPAEVFKRNAITKLVDMAYADAATLRTARQAEVNALFSVQAELRHRGRVRRMGDEKEALERSLQDVMMATDVIQSWVMENNRRGDTHTADDAIQPADILSRQMIECMAADLALEDTIYAFDKILQFGGYLKSVRALAHEQFFHRALSAKVHSAQQQAKAATMTARAL